MIPAYNEETALEDRINNLAEVYPKDKMEIIISNDGSSDNTEEIAKNTPQKHSLTGKVITHARSGVNKAINRGINETSNEIVVITGANGLFDKDTIPDLVRILLSSDDIGAVSGDLIPVAKGDTVFSRSESAYRSIYGRNAHERAMLIQPIASMGLWWHLRKLHRPRLILAGVRMTQVWRSL